MQQANDPHPLGFYMWRRFQRFREMWWCLTGKWSLHRAWQMGYDYHASHEMARHIRGGR